MLLEESFVFALKWGKLTLMKMKMVASKSTIFKMILGKVTSNGGHCDRGK